MSKNISFKDFLKKYSTLSNLFIEDFYTIYNYNENENEDFIINIDVISKWLEIPRGKIKKTLINTYNKNIDYIIEFDKNNKISKSNKENILLTPDCFKRLCLLSRTKKAEEVRTYFIEIEKLLFNYKDYIIKALEKTVNILENNQKEVDNKVKSVIYIIRSMKDIDGIYRFGRTENFKKRLQNYNSSNSDKMEVIYVYETKDSKKIEDCVISQIKPLRYKKRKDFYEIDINILKNIISSCKNLTLKYKKKINNKILDGGANINMYMFIHYF